MNLSQRMIEIIREPSMAKFMELTTEEKLEVIKSEKYIINKKINK